MSGGFVYLQDDTTDIQLRITLRYTPSRRQVKLTITNLTPLADIQSETSQRYSQSHAKAEDVPVQEDEKHQNKTDLLLATFKSSKTSRRTRDKRAWAHLVHGTPAK